ncbi:MAG: hypothetical protein ACRDKT_15895 [Actinomycetota bacterium]
MTSSLVALVAAGLFVTSCSGGSASEGAKTPTRSPTPTKTVARGVELQLDGEPAGIRLIRRGIQDVKRLGLWKRLTRHLHVVKINAYSGHHNVPRDGHLADAISGVMESSDRELGLSCDVVFYMAAIGREMRLSRAGVLVRTRPSIRITYASIVAHELAHCLPGPHGEKVARRWEYRVERLLTR